MTQPVRRAPMVAAAAVAALLAGSCGETIEVPYAAPEATEDGLATGEPAAVGVRMNVIAPLIEKIRSEGYVNIHPLVVLRKDRLVVEEYFPGVSDGGVEDTSLVVVFTGWNDGALERQALEMMGRHVPPGVSAASR